MRSDNILTAIAAPVFLGLLTSMIDRHVGANMGLLAWTAQTAVLTAVGVSILSRQPRLIIVALLLYFDASFTIYNGNRSSGPADDRILVFINVSVLYVLQAFRAPLRADENTLDPTWLWNPLYVYILCGLLITLPKVLDLAQVLTAAFLFVGLLTMLSTQAEPALRSAILRHRTVRPLLVMIPVVLLIGALPTLSLRAEWVVLNVSGYFGTITVIVIAVRRLLGVAPQEA